MKGLTSNHLPEEVVRGSSSFDRFMHNEKCGGVYTPAGTLTSGGGRVVGSCGREVIMAEVR
jgi:hypothetical protein